MTAQIGLVVILPQNNNIYGKKKNSQKTKYYLLFQGGLQPRLAR